MKKILEDELNFDIVMDEVVEIFYEGNVVIGVGIKLGCLFKFKVVILVIGVYLNLKIYMGEVVFYEGFNVLGYVKYFIDSLVEFGFRMRRFKMGILVRVYRDSIDFFVMFL